MSARSIASLGLTLALALTAPADAQSTPNPLPSPSPVVSPVAPASPSPTLAPIGFVRGQLLAATPQYLVFTTGDALRLRAGTTIPKRATLGSLIRATLDVASHDVTAVELDPGKQLVGEIDAGAVPRAYVVSSPRSARTPAPPGQSLGTNARGQVTVTIVVHVPANTPFGDDVYLATERSNYSPAEIRMQRLDAETFATSLGLAAGTRLRYQFTRGSFANVERTRDGSIAAPHFLEVTPNAKSDDTVARWADII